MRPIRAAGSGTCAGWWPASGSPGARTGPPRSSAGRRRGLVSSPTARSCAGWPTSRSFRAPSSAWTSTDWPLRPPVRCRQRCCALPRFTREVDGVRKIVEEPPLITRLLEREAELLAEALDEYLHTLSPHWRRVLGGYTLVDVAHKVVGVGSVGLRAYVALLEGSSTEDVVFLQLKQARRSVLARYVHGESAWHAHQGQRVVEYQQALQTVSDPLLGWTTVGPYQYYVRQFRNMKGSIAVESIDATALADYAAVVGHLLAKGHARTSGASMIVGYVGSSDRLDVALARFARLYADQTEADHASLVKAADRGILPIERGL